jgi:hypothetical protein
VNTEDIVHNSNSFWANAKPGMQASGIDRKLMNEVLRSKDLSKLDRIQQSRVLDWLVKHGPQLQNAETAKHLSDSFSGGRLGYRMLAGGALKADTLTNQLLGYVRRAKVHGRTAALVGGGLTGASLLGRYLNRKPNQATYRVNVPMSQPMQAPTAFSV